MFKLLDLAYWIIKYLSVFSLLNERCNERIIWLRPCYPNNRSFKRDGFAMAEALAEYGAYVILNSRDETALREKVRALTERGLKASYQVFDVTDSEAGKNAIQTIFGEFGSFYGLVNNAGIQFRSLF